jgi:hypothetical protein
VPSTSSNDYSQAKRICALQYNTGKSSTFARKNGISYHHLSLVFGITSCDQRSRRGYAHRRHMDAFPSPYSLSEDIPQAMYSAVPEQQPRTMMQSRYWAFQPSGPLTSSIAHAWHSSLWITTSTWAKIASTIPGKHVIHVVVTHLLKKA